LVFSGDLGFLFCRSSDVPRCRFFLLFSPLEPISLFLHTRVLWSSSPQPSSCDGPPMRKVLHVGRAVLPLGIYPSSSRVPASCKGSALPWIVSFWECGLSLGGLVSSPAALSSVAAELFYSSISFPPGFDNLFPSRVHISHFFFCDSAPSCSREVATSGLLVSPSYLSNSPPGVLFSASTFFLGSQAFCRNRILGPFRGVFLSAMRPVSYYFPVSRDFFSPRETEVR